MKMKKTREIFKLESIMNSQSKWNMDTEELKSHEVGFALDTIKFFVILHSVL